MASSSCVTGAVADSPNSVRHFCSTVSLTRFEVGVDRPGVYRMHPIQIRWATGLTVRYATLQNWTSVDFKESNGPRRKQEVAIIPNQSGSDPEAFNIPVKEVPAHIPGRPHISTVRRWIEREWLDSRKVGGRLFVSLAAIDKFKNGRGNRGRAPPCPSQPPQRQLPNWTEQQLDKIFGPRRHAQQPRGP